MEQTATEALIVAIIAIVLGALGLIGGLIGYVQGTAALRRATVTRQRATAAEEAALGARAQAEQSARIAQDALDRLSRLQVRSLGDVADQPTGPLILPSRMTPPPRTSPIRSSGQSDPIDSSGPSDSSGSTGPIETADPVGIESAPEPAEAPGTGPTAVQASETVAPEPTWFEAPSATSGSAVPEAMLESGPAPSESAPESGPAVPEAAPDPGPSPTQQAAPTPVAAATATIAAPVAADADAHGARHATGGRSERMGDAVPRTGPTPLPPVDSPSSGPITLPPSDPAPTPDDPTSDDPTPDAGAPDDGAPQDETPQPETSQPETPEHETTEDAPPVPAAASSQDEAESVAPRSSTGQVTAGMQEAPPMDWSEALRTGAIPLPNRSRGTYAAPAKGIKPASGPARFEIRLVGRQRFEVVNVGGQEAQLAAVEGVGEDRHLVRPVEPGPVAVRPGASLAFSLLRVEGREVSVQVTWQRDGIPQEVELAVP